MSMYPGPFPVPADAKWATLDTATGQILGRRLSWPRPDFGEVQGQDPNSTVIWLKHVDFPQPGYDSRYYLLQGVETPDAENHEIRLTWQAVKRPLEEIKTAATNVEIEHAATQFPLERLVLETALAVTAIIAGAIDMQTLPAKHRTYLTAYRTKGTKLWQNRETLDGKIVQIEANQEPDLDAGWQT